MNDRTLGIAALALAAFMTWAGWDIEAPFAYEPVGPRAFPLLLALIIGLCGLRLAIKGGNPVQANAPGANGRIALMVLFCAGYAFLFQWLAYRRHRVDDGGGGPVVRRRLGQVRHRRRGHERLLFVLFDKVLDVVLPGGLLENLI